MTTYVLKGEQQLGPFQDIDIQAGIADGKFGYDDPAWREGMEEWVPLGTLYPEQEEIAGDPEVEFAGGRISRRQMFWDAVVYPFCGKGWIMIGTGAVFSALPVMRWLADAYFAAFYFDVIASTITDSDEAPDWPSVSDIWDDIVVPFFRVTGVNLISILPAAIIGFLIGTRSPSFFAGMAAGVAIWCLYYPTAMLDMVIFRNLTCALPHRVIPAVFRCLTDCVILAAIFGLSFCASILVRWSLPEIPIVHRVLTEAVSLYFLMVQGRLIGLHYRRNADRIGWV